MSLTLGVLLPDEPPPLVCGALTMGMYMIISSSMNVLHDGFSGFNVDVTHATSVSHVTVVSMCGQWVSECGQQPGVSHAHHCLLHMVQ